MSNNLINYFAEVLAHTKHGMTWTQIARFFRRKSAEYNVPIPYGTTIFPSHLTNRRVGFIENLKAFSSGQQVLLLLELCDAHKAPDVTPLKKILINQHVTGNECIRRSNHQASLIFDTRSVDKPDCYHHEAHKEREHPNVSYVFDPSKHFFNLSGE